MLPFVAEKNFRLWALLRAEAEVRFPEAEEKKIRPYAYTYKLVDDDTLTSSNLDKKVPFKKTLVQFPRSEACFPSFPHEGTEKLCRYLCTPWLCQLLLHCDPDIIQISIC